MPSHEFSIEKIFLILRRRALLIGNVLAAVILIAAAVTYQMPKMYRSTASLYFDFSGNNPLDSRGRSILSEDSYLTTQVGVIGSLNVAQRVVDSFSDYERERVIVALENGRSSLERFLNGAKHFVKSLFSVGSGGGDEVTDAAEVAEVEGSLPVRSPYNWLARAIRNDLVVSPLVNSRIVEVSFYSADPKVAALVADRFAEAYIQTNLQMVIDPARKSKVWFDEQLKALRARLEEAQSRLTAYQQQEGIVSSDQRIDMEMNKLRGLADQLVAAQQARRNAETQKQKLEEVLLQGASLETFEPVFSNPIVQRIKAEIRDLEGRLVESSADLGVNHPKIKKLKSELSAARRRLAAEIRTITDGINNAADLSRKREATLEEAVAAQKQLVLKLKNEHDQIEVLKREVESAQTAYNAALNQSNTTSMQSMVDQTNVTIVDHASVPAIHATPRIAMNLALGAFAGLVLGIGLALFMEVFIRRVYSRDDLVDELGIPMLGHLRKN